MVDWGKHLSLDWFWAGRPGTSRLLTHIGKNSRRSSSESKSRFYLGRERKRRARGSWRQDPGLQPGLQIASTHCSPGCGSQGAAGKKEIASPVRMDGSKLRSALCAGSVSSWDFMCLQGWVVSELCHQILSLPSGWEGVLLQISAMVLVP